MSQDSPAIRYTPASAILGHIAALSHNREVGFDLSSSARMVTEALASGGAFQLAVGSDLDAAVDLLRELLEAPAGDAARERRGAIDP